MVYVIEGVMQQRIGSGSSNEQAMGNIEAH
jgi:hypothetical protein